MNCWNCDNSAQAACIFCGRFICKDDAKRRTNILAMFVGDDETPKIIPVVDAIWCGICEPKDPIPMPELF